MVPRYAMRLVTQHVVILRNAICRVDDERQKLRRRY